MLAPIRKHAQKLHFYVIVSPTSFPSFRLLSFPPFLLWSCWADNFKLSWLVVAFSYDVGQIVCVFFVVFAPSCVSLSGKSRSSSQGWFQAAVCDNKLSVQYLFNELIFFFLFFTDFILSCGVGNFWRGGQTKELNVVFFAAQDMQQEEICWLICTGFFFLC